MVLIVFWVVLVYTTAALLTAVIVYPNVEYQWSLTGDGERQTAMDHFVTLLLAILMGFAWPWWLAKLISRVVADVRSR